MRISPIPALIVLAVVGALSLGDWWITSYELKFKHVGRAAATDIVARNDVFRTLRSFAARVDTAAHPGQSVRLVYASDPSRGPAPIEVETYYIFYPEIPLRKDVRDPNFKTFIKSLTSGSAIVSELPLELPRAAETIDGHGYFIYVLT